MAKTGHTGFPVVENGRLVGIVTNRDVSTIRVADKTYPSIREAMTSPPVVIHPDDTLEDALVFMVGHNFDHMPVVRPETPDILSGFLTRSDILRAVTFRQIIWQRAGNKNLHDTESPCQPALIVRKTGKDEDVCYLTKTRWRSCLRLRLKCKIFRVEKFTNSRACTNAIHPILKT